MDMYEFAHLLVSLGLVNAINLDGGGSTTMVVNGSLVNYPSDLITIDGQQYSTARKVSTVLCVHDVPCSPANCSGHGICRHGICHCHGNWRGPKCDILQCDFDNCTLHGLCTEDGCQCFAGWQGANCSTQCPAGRYGFQCSGQCQCTAHSTGCSPVDGRCICAAGYRGYLCDTECALGTYGKNCSGVCQCYNKCFCDRVTGSCDSVNDTYWKDGQCLGGLAITSQRNTVLTTQEYWWWIGGLTTFCTVAAISLILNIFLLSRRIACLGRSQTKRTLPMRRTNIVYDAAPLVDDVSTSDMDSDEEYYRKTFAPSRVSDRVVQNDSYRPSGALGENVDSSDHGTDVAAISETLPMVEL